MRGQPAKSLTVPLRKGTDASLLPMSTGTHGSLGVPLFNRDVGKGNRVGYSSALSPECARGRWGKRPPVFGTPQGQGFWTCWARATVQALHQACSSTQATWPGLRQTGTRRGFRVRESRAGGTGGEHRSPPTLRLWDRMTRPRGAVESLGRQESHPGSILILKLGSRLESKVWA